MANQINYKQDINSIARRDGVLRFATNLTDPIILEEDAAYFAYTRFDNVELHLYEIASNILIASAIVPLTDGTISARVYTNEHVDFAQKIVLEMTEIVRKYFQDVKPGIYDLTINFFSDMVGSSEEKLRISTISPSRKEIVVTFGDSPTPQQLLQFAEFVPPSVNKRLAQGIIEQLFNSQNVLDQTATAAESLTVDDVDAATSTTTAGIRLDYINQYDKLMSLIPGLLDKIYKNTIKQLVDASTMYPERYTRIQQADLELFIVTAINEEVTKFIQAGHFDARVRLS